MPEIIPQPRSTVTIKSAPSGPQQTLGFCLRTWKVGLTRTRGSEKIAVRAGAGQFKDENVLMNLVDEQPVGCDMAFAVIGPVVAEGVVAVCRRKGFAIGEFGDDRMKLFDRHMPPQHQLVVAFERRGVSDDILHFAKSFHICPRSVYAGWFGSCAMRSPSSIAAMVSAFGNGSAEMVKGMRFSRITVLMYTVITDDAERPTLSQKSTKRFLVGASSENVMFAIVFLHSFESKTLISYTKLTGVVKGAAYQVSGMKEFGDKSLSPNFSLPHFLDRVHTILTNRAHYISRRREGPNML